MSVHLHAGIVPRRIFDELFAPVEVEVEVSSSKQPAANINVVVSNEVTRDNRDIGNLERRKFTKRVGGDVLNVLLGRCQCQRAFDRA